MKSKSVSLAVNVLSNRLRSEQFASVVISSHNGSVLSPLTLNDSPFLHRANKMMECVIIGVGRLGLMLGLGCARYSALNRALPLEHLVDWNRSIFDKTLI